MSTIDRVRFSRAVEYPDSDGSLIAESDWHRDELFDLIYRLKERYADRPDVYVSGHMFVYYEEGQPRQVIAPDVMVVFERYVSAPWTCARAAWDAPAAASRAVTATSPPSSRKASRRCAPRASAPTTSKCAWPARSPARRGRTSTWSC